MPTRPRNHRRIIRSAGPTDPDTTILGLDDSGLGDLYHFLMRESWTALLAAVVLIFILINTIFAIAYMLVHGIENARPGSFSDAFFFSVQTMATIGYGQLVPTSFAANVLVSIEAFIGLLALAIMTGLIFAKFSRPSARVRFSKVAIVSNRDGIPSLQFRMANMRANRIVDVSARVVFARQEKTLEGEEMRRFYDLKLQRDRNSLFIYSWTAIHPITEDSPMNGLSIEAMEAASAEIIVSVIGLDETFAQTIHARYSYRPREILWGGRFVDILERRPDGALSIDYTHFDDVVPPQ
ncbi:MAG TPA: ion channel [Candidatus Binataceae bacterium]|nr:ion channel [Candidatus Binataceae bacterium]